MTYAIGLPGEQPRLLIPVDQPDGLESFMEPNEVIVPVSGVGDWIISQGGEYATPRTKTLSELQLEKWYQVKDKRDIQIEAGAPVPNVGIFDMDADSRVNLLGASTMAQAAKAANQPLQIGWKMHNNSIVQLNADQIIASANAVAVFYSRIHARSQQLYIAILAATSAAQLDAIDINTGWPS